MSSAERPGGKNYRRSHMSDANDGWESAPRKSQGDFAETWKPTEPGEILQGVIAEIRTATFSNNTCDVADIALSDGSKSMSVFMSRVSLRGQWEDLKPGEGDTIKITYLGEKETQSGRSFFDYEVLLKRRTPRVSENMPF